MRTIEVKALIVKDGKFLMLRRGKEWDVPGARMTSKTATSTLVEAVKRSCGLAVEIIKPVKLSSYSEKGKVVFVVVFLCRYKSGKVKTGKDYSSFRWVKPAVVDYEEKEDYMQVGK